jgi:hypothetical protein
MCLSFLASGLVAAPALELALHLVQASAQPFDGSRDLPDIIAGDGPCLIDSRHGWPTGLLSGVRAVWEAITLITKAEGVAELEVGAAPIRVAPKGRGVLSKGRREAEEAGDKDHDGHRSSMNRSAGPVEPPQRRYREGWNEAMPLSLESP